MKANTKLMLEKLNNRYRDILKSQNPDSIKKALQIIEKSKEKTLKSENSDIVKFDLSGIDQETLRIFELLDEYKQSIKQIFIKNHEYLTHITSVSRKNMVDGKIKAGYNANNYSTERDKWAFASSTPIR